MDENTRRYYLDTMGIQCWQRVVVEESVLESDQQSAHQPLQQIDEAVKPAVERVAEQANREAGLSDWSAFETAVKQCEQCALRVSACQPMTGTGNRGSELMFVLLAPAADNALLTPEADALLVKMLAAIGISIDDVYITSLLKCRLPVNHTISAKEVLSCRQHLKQQVRMVAPRQLVVLGETAARCLLQKSQSLDELRAICNQSQQQLLEDTSLFLSYSPQELLLNVEDKRKAWTDLQQLQALLGN